MGFNLVVHHNMIEPTLLQLVLTNRNIVMVFASIDGIVLMNCC